MGLRFVETSSSSDLAEAWSIIMDLLAFELQDPEGAYPVYEQQLVPAFNPESSGPHDLGHGKS